MMELINNYALLASQVVLTLVLFWGCTPSAVKFADEMYEEAKALKDSGNFNLAKIKLDSVMLLAGNQSENLVTPSVELTLTLPLCAKAMDLVIANPKPEPSPARCRDESTR